MYFLWLQSAVFYFLGMVPTGEPGRDRTPTYRQPRANLTNPMETYAIRLKPGQDLKREITQLARERRIRAGCVVTCVGSLRTANLRFANQAEATPLEGKYEIVSLVGTFSDESSHLHLSIADSTGVTIGGHLMEGNLIYTTAELVIGVMPGLEFAREIDPTYGYPELVVKKRDR